MDTGKHTRELEAESLYDSIRKKWAMIVTGVTPQDETQLQSSDESQPGSSVSVGRASLGWALKTARKSPRMTEKAKAFLMQKFEAGTGSGQKADSAQVSREMKFVQDESGQPLFKPEEWRTAHQIGSFFSRLSAVQRQNEVLKGTEEQKETVREEDVAAWQSELVMETLRQAVLADMDSPADHPVEVEGKNICQLFRSNKLCTLKLSELKDICEKLDLTVQGSTMRKKSYIEPIAVYVKACSCSQT